MNIDTVKAQENLDEPEKAFELDNVAVRLVRSREPLMSDEPFSNPDSVVRALSEQMRDFNRERYQSENNFVTESVTDDMTYEPDIEQTTGMRI